MSSQSSRYPVTRNSIEGLPKNNYGEKYSNSPLVEPNLSQMLPHIRCHAQRCNVKCNIAVIPLRHNVRARLASRAIM